MPRKKPRIKDRHPEVSRRRFLQATAATSAVALAAPGIVTAKKTDGSVVVGQGEYRYEVDHHWARLPSEFSWQTTHNVAVDREGLLYVIHEGHSNQPDHPSIFVFDRDGKYVRSFGQQFQGGGHGLEVRDEGGEEFLYVAAYQKVKKIAKLTLTGETVWEQGPPMQSGVYAEDENTSERAKVWGPDRFLPTNFAFLPDGGFYLSDGYGSNYIHRYDKNAKWQSCFGGIGTEDGKFKTAHGIWMDDRQGGEPDVVIVDRANARLQWFDIAGNHKHTLDGFLFPANADVLGDVMLVPDLHARVTLLDKANRPVAQLGDDSEWRKQALEGFKMRGQPDRWQPGRFIHPHDACFDPEGNIFVAEWVATGRVSRLRKAT